jgi:hypothetical protein
MRIAIIQNGQVVNVVEADDPWSVALEAGESALSWDDAIAQGVPLAPALSSPDEPQAPQRVFRFLDFLGLFTTNEQAAIIASDVVQVKLFVLMAAGAGNINLDDPLTAEGLDLLVAQSLLTADRRAEVFAGQAPV